MRKTLKNLFVVNNRFSIIRQLGSVLLFIVAAFLFMRQTFLPSLQTQTHGFAAYYTGAWLLQHNRANSLYDPVGFNTAMQESGISGIYDIYDANAPLLAALTSPLALWTPMMARAIWLWFNLGLLLLAFFVASRLLKGRGLLPFSLAGAFLLSYAPLRENFRLGQMYMPFLLATLLSLAFSSSIGRSLVLGFELVLKLYYGFFGLIAGLARPKSVVWTALFIPGMALLVLPWLGPALWIDYARLATGFSARPETAVTAYQTLNSFFAHLFRYDVRWNPQPVANLPLLTSVLIVLADGLLLGISGLLIWKAYRVGLKQNSRLTRLIVALALTLSPLLAPIAEEYHFTILALPLLIASIVWSPASGVHNLDSKTIFGFMSTSKEQEVFESERRMQHARTGSQGHSRTEVREIFKRFRLWTADSGLRTLDCGFWTISWLLLALPLGYKEWPAGGWQAIINYPRLYGAFLLWVLLVRLIRVELLTGHPLPLSQNIDHGQ